MVSFNININNRTFILFGFLLIIILLGGIVIAYNSAGNPAVFGHSANEIVMPVPESWKSMTLLNGWQVTTNAYGTFPALYFKDNSGVVHFKGIIRCNGGASCATGGIFFKLPAGYLPVGGSTESFVVMSNNKACRIDVNADSGDVYAFDFCDTSQVSLSGISFRAS